MSLWVAFLISNSRSVWEYWSSSASSIKSNTTHEKLCNLNHLLVCEWHRILLSFCIQCKSFVVLLTIRLKFLFRLSTQKPRCKFHHCYKPGVIVMKCQTAEIADCFRMIFWQIISDKSFSLADFAAHWTSCQFKISKRFENFCKVCPSLIISCWWSKQILCDSTFSTHFLQPLTEHLFLRCLCAVAVCLQTSDISTNCFPQLWHL